MGPTKVWPRDLSFSTASCVAPLAHMRSFMLGASITGQALGRTEQARKVEAAVAFDLSTRDPRAAIRTAEVGDRLAALAGG